MSSKEDSVQPKKKKKKVSLKDLLKISNFDLDFLLKRSQKGKGTPIVRWTFGSNDQPVTNIYMGFTDGSVVKSLPANAGDVGLILGSGRSPGERNGNALQYSCLGNTMDKGAWNAIVHAVKRVGCDLATKQQYMST